MTRPPKPAEERRTIHVPIMLTPAEHEKLKAMADSEGLSMMSYIRRRLLYQDKSA